MNFALLKILSLEDVVVLLLVVRAQNQEETVEHVVFSQVYLEGKQGKSWTSSMCLDAY